MLYTPVRGIELGTGMTFCDLQRDTFYFRFWTFGKSLNCFLLRQSPTFQKQVARIAVNFEVISRKGLQLPMGIEPLPGLKEVWVAGSFGDLKNANMELMGLQERYCENINLLPEGRAQKKLREYGLVVRTAGGEAVGAKHIKWIYGEPRKRAIFSRTDLIYLRVDGDPVYCLYCYISNI